MWLEAAEEYDLPFGLTEHLGATYKWFATNKDSDEKGPYTGVPFYFSDKYERGVKVKFASPGLNIIAYLYNTSAQNTWKKQSCLCPKRY